MWARSVAVNAPPCHGGDRRFDSGRARQQKDDLLVVLFCGNILNRGKCLRVYFPLFIFLSRSTENARHRAVAFWAFSLNARNASCVGGSFTAFRANTFFGSS
jgi:hypothetical protein